MLIVNNISVKIMFTFWFILYVLFSAVLGFGNYKCNGLISISYFDDISITICCNEGLLHSSLLGKETYNSSPEHVTLVSCQATGASASVATVLGEKNITLPRSLIIAGQWDSTSLRHLISGLDNLQNLTLNHLRFKTRMPAGIIETLHSLKILHLIRVELPRKIFNSTIAELTIERAALDQSMHFDKLRVLKLRSVDFEYSFENHFTISYMKQSLLKQCTALENLTLSAVEPDKLSFFLKGVSLKVLRINNCAKLESLPASFVDYFDAKPEILDLSRNALIDIHPNVFKGLKKLTKLDLSHNKFTDIKFQDILQMKSLNKEIDLRDNPLEFIHFEEEEYIQLATQINEMGVNITLLVNSQLDCECHNGWLARAVRDFPSLVVAGVCWDDERSNLSLELKECAKLSCYPGCYCRKQGPENEMTLRCRGLTSMPNVPNMHAVFARSNHISQLQLETLPDSLKCLDLSDNNITRMDRAVAEKLFSVSKRRVWLAGNPIVCDCENQPFIKALQDHNTQVLDYNKIMCYDEAEISQPLSYIILDPFCVGTSETSNKFNLATVLSVIFTFLIVVAIFIALYHRFKMSLKEYLFVQGYCSFCISEEEESDYDSSVENPTDGHTNMPYDVFLSFCHKDEDFILEELLPGLESDPTHPYKVCIHYRDWIAGEFIPKQITQSVERSRRTLIVLSRNFVKSAWSRLEFRSALMCEIRGSGPRLVVVVLDDVVSDPNLDYELRNYVRNNTYIRRDDPLFWKKLRYALPRRKMNTRTSEKADNFKSNRVRRCNNNNESTILTNFNDAELNRVYPNDYTEQ